MDKTFGVFSSLAPRLSVISQTKDDGDYLDYVFRQTIPSLSVIDAHYSAKTMSTKRYNVGIVGYGMSAKVFHIPLIQVLPDNFKLYAIVQRSPHPNNDCSKDHPTTKHYSNTDDLLKDPAVDVVIITTTPPSHHEICKAALHAGKNVIVEKPFTPTSKEARDLLQIAKTQRKLLTVYQNRRWDTDFLTLHNLLEDGRLGRVVEFETHFDRHRPSPPDPNSTWKAQPLPGGGAIYDLGTHLIDQVVVAFGLPDKITGFIGPQREYGQGHPSIDDSCTVLLQYPHGLLVTVKAGVVSPEMAQLRYWVRGEKGSYQKFHLDCQEDQLKEGKKPGDAGFGVEGHERAGSLTLQEEGSEAQVESCPNIEPVTYKVFYEKVAEALAEGGVGPVDPQGPADVIRLIELAKLSSREGRTITVAERFEGIDG